MTVVEEVEKEEEEDAEGEIVRPLWKLLSSLKDRVLADLHPSREESRCPPPQMKAVGSSTWLWSSA